MADASLSERMMVRLRLAVAFAQIGIVDTLHQAGHGGVVRQHRARYGQALVPSRVQPELVVRQAIGPRLRLREMAEADGGDLLQPELPSQTGRDFVQRSSTPVSSTSTRPLKLNSAIETATCAACSAGCSRALAE